MIAMSKNLKNGILVCSILILTSLVFLPSLKNGFVNWDDDFYVTSNRILKILSFDNLKSIFTSFFLGNYQPLTHLTYLADYHFFKLDPAGYHFTNLLFHLLNCWLVFRLFLLLTDKTGVSFLVALLFGIHPLHVESVAWISERKDVLYGFFYLASLISYLSYVRQGRKPKYYCLCLIFFVLSLLSKAMAITLPLVLFLLDYFVSDKIYRPAWKDKIPFFIFACIFSVIAVVAQNSSGAIRHEEMFHVLRSFSVAVFAVVFYLSKILFPFRLSCLYSSEPAWNAVFFWPVIFFVAITIGVCVVARSLARKIVFGILFFLIVLLPVLQFIPIGRALVADRYAYISSLGIFYCLAEIFTWLYGQKIKNLSRCIKICLSLMLAGAFIVLGLLTWQRCEVWCDSAALWKDALRSDSRDVRAHAYYMLGDSYFKKENYEEARNCALESMRLNPEWDCLGLLGDIYLKENELKKALAYYERAKQLNPSCAITYNNLGVVYFRMGVSQWDKANGCYQHAIALNPAYSGSYFNLGLLCEAQGKGLLCEKYFTKALELAAQPDAVLWHLADFYANHKLDKALDIGQRILEQGPATPETYFRLGMILLKLGQEKAAEQFFMNALSLDPTTADALIALGILYGNQGQFDKSIVYFKKALAFKPDQVPLKQMLKKAIELKEKAGRHAG